MKSKEEIVASKLSDLLADSRLQHNIIGRYVAQSFSTEMYDKFVELVTGAETEKNGRIEWLKRIIIGDDNMTFDKKCEILAGVWTKSDEISNQEYIAMNDVGLSIAFALVHELVTGVTEKGADYVEISYTNLVDEYGLDEDEMNDTEVEDIVAYIV